MTLSLPPSETPDGPTQNRGYEARDLMRGSLPAAVGLILIGAALLQFTMYEIYHHLQARQRDVDSPSSVVASDGVSTGRTLPPLLPEDVRLLREHENSVFEKLGWKTSGNTADVKIPDAVIDALKERK